MTAMRQLPNVYNALCPTRAILDRVADKWTTLIVGALLEDNNTPKRFSVLMRRIGGISQKMLTQTLRTLERDGLVERRIYAEVPPRVEYQLTALGESLAVPIAAIQAWAETHMSAILTAQAHYDERNHEPEG